MPADTQYSFEDNTLVIRDQYSCTKIQWGEKPSARMHFGNGQSKECWPEQRILFPDRVDAGANREAIDSFTAQIPAEIIELVSPFADHQWAMLRLLAYRTPALELARTNPVLAYCLANNFQFRSHVYKHEISWEQANYYARRKQKQILKFLGFPDTNIIVKLMKKIDTTEISIALLRLLKAALIEDNPTVKLLSHYKTITPGMLGLLRTFITPLVTPRIVADVAKSERERFYSHTADRLTDIQHMKNAAPVEVDVQPLQGMRAVADTHETFLLQIRDAVAEHRRQQNYLGDPPFEGTDTIIPISTKDGLRLEGKHMKNCVGTYIDKVLRGEMYIYKVLAPQRATMSIIPQWGREWRCCELKLKCNKQPGTKTKDAVITWLREKQKPQINADT